MQPTSREMQGMSPSMASMPPPPQQQQQIWGAGLQQFDDSGASSHDDFFEQVMSSLPWADLNHGGNHKSPWDLPGAQKLEQALGEEGLRYTTGPYDESALLASRLRQHQISAAPGEKPMALQINHQAAQQQQHHMLLSAMGRSGVGGDPGLLPLPLSTGSADSADSRLLVDRSRNDADPLFKSPNSSGGKGLYNGFGGSLQGAAQAAATNAQHFHGPQGGGALPSQNYGAAAAVGMGQTAAAAAGAAGAGAAPPRQRVRARRGQATDPHSIAERLRRERIAERMKALQEMVPNANKTDKASMLDEIIDYVKFLQLQVKVLSMSRLGAVAAVDTDQASGGAGNPAARTAAPGGEDSLTLAEHQVAKLMEEDMGAAMQYLQGKGLCLMPISLASVISTAICHSRPAAHPGGAGGGVGNQGNGNPAGMPHAPAPNGDAPPSPCMSVLTVQSATANGDADAARSSAKDSKP